MELLKAKPTPGIPYQKMYTTLFNAITDALNLMDENAQPAAVELLKCAQQETEDIYISQHKASAAR